MQLQVLSQGRVYVGTRRRANVRSDILKLAIKSLENSFLLFYIFFFFWFEIACFSCHYVS